MKRGKDGNNVHKEKLRKAIYAKVTEDKNGKDWDGYKGNMDGQNGT